MSNNSSAEVNAIDGTIITLAFRSFHVRTLQLSQAFMKLLFRTWFLTSLIFLLCLGVAFAQPEKTNHYDFNAGLSSTDATNFGARNSFGQNDIGVNIGGTLPTKGFFQVISSISYYRHLWGHSKHTGIMPWYCKAAVHFHYSESELTPGNFSHTRSAGVRLYMGRDFNLSPRLALSSSLGPIFIFFDEFYGRQRVKPHTEGGLDLMIFYRL
jgi:hypothetical protein